MYMLVVMMVQNGFWVILGIGFTNCYGDLPVEWLTLRQ